MLISEVRPSSLVDFARPARRAGRSRGRRPSASASISPLEAVWLLSSFCTLHQRSFDADLLRRECVLPLALGDLERLADRLGLNAKWQRVAAGKLRRSRAPLAVEVSPGATQEASSASAGAVEPGHRTVQDGDQPASAPADRTEWLILLSV